MAKAKQDEKKAAQDAKTGNVATVKETAAQPDLPTGQHSRRQ